MPLQEYEEKYTTLFFDLQRQQWENYESGAGHNLDIVDSVIFKLLQEYESCDFPEGRRGKIARKIINRGLVDKHPEVSALRNRLDDWDNYLQVLSTEETGDPHQRRLALAKAMEPDVLRLMLLRNQLSSRQGYQSYVHLVMDVEELVLDNVQCMVERFLDENIARARCLAIEHGLTWSNWFSQLDAIVKNDVPFEYKDVMETLCRTLDLSEGLASIMLYDQGPLAGYVGVLDAKNDIRLMVRGTPTLASIRTLCHELGHALSHSMNRAEGLYTTWTAISDETMAVIIERLGTEILFTDEQRKIVEDITLLENVRVSLSFLFEMDLWKNPERATELYSKHYAALGLKDCLPALWSLDSFRSVDAVYVHNYICGAIFAEMVHIHLRGALGEDYKEWGKWIKVKLFEPGQRHSLGEKLAGIKGTKGLGLTSIHKGCSML